jgi:hypothetical protein
MVIQDQIQQKVWETQPYQWLGMMACAYHLTYSGKHKFKRMAIQGSPWHKM